ncbi:MAG: efflux RND transporter periplasmic adaptor subunit [Sphingomonadales bacterium]
MRPSLDTLTLRLPVILLIAGFIAGCGGDPPKDDASRSAMTITTATAKARPMARTVTVMGTVVAWEEMPVGAEVGGLAITEVLVDEGDEVKRGQVLARLNDSVLRAQLAQQEAGIVSARAQLTEAQANLRRAEELLPKGHISGQTADARRASASTAQAQLALAEAARDETRAKLEQTRIVSPDDGYVSARSAVIGQIVNSGDQLFRVVRDSRLELDAEIPESTLPVLAPGLAVQVSAEGVAPTTATIRAVAPSVDTKSRLGLAHIALPPGSGFRPGMFAQASVALKDSAALMVPASAVVYRDGAAGVFVTARDGTVRFRKVVTGERAGDLVEVSDGLAAGDQVALKGAGFLEDGDKVTVAGEPGGNEPPLANTEHRPK